MGALIAWHCTKKDFNSLPTIPAFKDTEEKRLWKTLWEKEKMLVTSIFFFSHSVFYSIKERNLHISNV